MTAHSRRFVITGLGAVTNVGLDVETTWTNVLAAKSGISTIDIWDASGHTAKIAGIIRDFEVEKYLNRRESNRLDRVSHLAIAAADEAWKDSGLNIEEIDQNRAGCIIGSGIGGLITLEDECRKLFERGARRVSPFLIPKLMGNASSGIVAIRLGLKGPNTCVTTACASASHSISEALLYMRAGLADVMMVGGSEATITQIGMAGFCSAKALSTRNDSPETASRPFDKDRDGFVMGEGAGLMVLEELEHAKKRGAKIYCELVGFGATDDAYHITAPAEGGEGAVRAMNLALEDAEINSDDVDYINAHGTSTAYNDKFETQAIKTTFGDYAKKVVISSTKSEIGHLLGASGALEAIFCAKAITNSVAPPTANYTTPDPECDLDYCPNTAREMNVDVAMSNSLGFGGHNCSLLFKKI